MAGSKNASVVRNLVHNPLEAVTSSVGHVGTEFKNQGKNSVDDFFNQLLGLDIKPKEKGGHGKSHGAVDMKPGQAVDLKGMKEKSKNMNILPGIDYRRDIVHGRERANMQEKQEMNQTIRQIKDELTRLVSSSKLLQAEFKSATMAPTPKETGKYHQNFFEWVLIMVRQARVRVEDSSSWVGAINKKKGQKGYWGMFKKHGTTFGMSNERSVATQTG